LRGIEARGSGEDGSVGGGGGEVVKDQRDWDAFTMLRLRKALLGHEPA